MNRKLFWLIPLLFSVPSFSSVDFDGADDYLDCGTTINPTAVTYSVWVKPETLTNTYQSIVDRQNVGATIYTELFVKSNGKIAIYMICSSGSPLYDGTGATTLTTGNWYHLALVYDATIGLIGYVNGTQDGTSAAKGNINTTAISTYVGKSPSFASREFDGLIDDVRIYNRALSANEIQTLANSHNRLTITSGLVGYWPLTDYAEGTSADGATIPDRSGNGNTCTGVDGANNTGLVGAGTILGNTGGHN